MARIRKEPKDRFNEKIVKPIDAGDCWEWIGGKDACGYGHFRQSRPVRKDILASHAAMQIYKNVPSLPRGICVLHKCDNPGCVNPDHLFLGTHADNMMDMSRKGRAARGEKSRQSKIKLHQIKEIRKRRKNGERAESVAKSFGVSKKTIESIDQKINWAWVSDV